MAELFHRAAGPDDGPLVCCLHGWPETGRIWVPTLEALAAAGLRGLAPDLPGYGHSPAVRPGTWATHVAAVDAFLADRGPAALVVHDWGGLIGLRWACEHPERITALVISGTGFFPDGKWHGIAEALRSPQGEALMAGLTRDAFAQLLCQSSTGIDDAALDEYWLAFADPQQRAIHLELYRSGEFAELAPYAGRLAALDVPTLLLWGASDPFAPLAGAHRFQREIPHAELQVLPRTGHFVCEDAPDAYAQAVSTFLAGALLPH